MEEFKLRKSISVLPLISCIIAIVMFGYLYNEVQTMSGEVNNEIQHLSSQISSIQNHPQDQEGSNVVLPIQEDMSEVYEDFSVLAMSSGRYDLARRYLLGSHPDRRDALLHVLEERELKKHEIQSLILSVLSQEKEPESGNAPSIFKSLISIEDIEVSPSHDMMITRNILLMAYLSAEMGFAGWEDVRGQLSQYAGLIKDVAPDLSEVCLEVSRYDVSLRVLND